MRPPLEAIGPVSMIVTFSPTRLERASASEGSQCEASSSALCLCVSGQVEMSRKGGYSLRELLRSLRHLCAVQ